MNQRKSANYYVILPDEQMMEFDTKTLAMEFLATLDDVNSVKAIIKGFQLNFATKLVLED